jgi:hypothetical protein
MIKLTRELMLKKLSAVFPDPVVADNALKDLDRLANAVEPAALDSVQLAVLKLSDGEIWLLRDWIKAAREDFEMVLSQAREPERFDYLRGKALKKNGAQTAAARTEMQKRDQRQWVEWLKG